MTGSDSENSECRKSTKTERIEQQRADMIRKWLDWDEQVFSRVVWLFENRRWYRRMVGILDQNPRMNRPNGFYDWLFGNYAYSMSMGIRRLLDPSQNTVSLARLVHSMAKHPWVISREYYVNGWIRDKPYPESARRLANEDYDFFAGKDREQLDPQRLERALQVVRRRAGKVLTYADQVVAHHQETRPSLSLTFAGGNRPVDCIGKLHNHIHTVLTRGHIHNYELIETEKWDWVFREPWIPQDGGTTD